TNICTSVTAIKYSNSDPAMAARYGRMNTRADYLRKNNFDSKEKNRKSLGIANLYDRTQLFTEIVGITSIANTFFKNSKSISSIKNLFSGPEGLRTKFLERNGSVYKSTPKSFLNGLKSIKNDKTFWSNLGKNFKGDSYNDKFTFIKNIRDKKTNFSFAKNTIISRIKGNSVEKVISRGIIKDFGNKLVKEDLSGLIKNIFKPSENIQKFDGSFRRIGINYTMPKPMTEGIRKINYINDIVKFNGVKVINGLNISNLKRIKQLPEKIKNYNKSMEYWNKYTPQKHKATKLTLNYEI
ncbi:hypothetical protein, partial [Clostridium sp. UBA7503]|uniref:hypothetical protein n=1 Tax=Clostridium sp. UBA7503 TaxID=1946377 RepID=UPI003216B459